jgi:hypothetical protein
MHIAAGLCDMFCIKCLRVTAGTAYHACCLVLALKACDLHIARDQPTADPAVSFSVLFICLQLVNCVCCMYCCVLQILLIRSLYSYVRVLPAYRMYRASKRHGSDLFHTCYTLSTAPQQQQQQHAAAAASHGGGRMCQFTFSSVETATGQFGISVEYQPATTVHFLEVGLLWRRLLLRAAAAAAKVCVTCGSVDVWWQCGQCQWSIALALRC